MAAVLDCPWPVSKGKFSPFAFLKEPISLESVSSIYCPEVKGKTGKMLPIVQ